MNKLETKTNFTNLDLCCCVYLLLQKIIVCERDSNNDNGNGNNSESSIQTMNGIKISTATANFH